MTQVVDSTLTDLHVVFEDRNAMLYRCTPTNAQAAVDEFKASTTGFTIIFEENRRVTISTTSVFMIEQTTQAETTRRLEEQAARQAGAKLLSASGVGSPLRRL